MNTQPIPGRLYKIVYKNNQRLKFFLARRSDNECILLEIGSIVFCVEKGEQIATELNIGIYKRQGFWFLNKKGEKFFISNEHFKILKEVSSGV